MIRYILSCFALAGCLSLGTLVVAGPLRAQETDALPWRAWMSGIGESSLLALPDTDTIKRDGSWSEPRATGPEPTWVGIRDRSGRFALWGAAIGAAAGLVAFTAADGIGCLGEDDPVTGRQMNPSKRVNCIFQTSLPIYVGGGALGGGVVGWLVERLTR
jgi:hypothetical protein